MQTSVILPLPRKLGFIISGNFKAAEAFKGGFWTASAIRGLRYVQQTYYHNETKETLSVRLE